MLHISPGNKKYTLICDECKSNALCNIVGNSELASLGENKLLKKIGWKFEKTENDGFVEYKVICPDCMKRERPLLLLEDLRNPHQLDESIEAVKRCSAMPQVGHDQVPLIGVQGILEKIKENYSKVATGIYAKPRTYTKEELKKIIQKFEETVKGTGKKIEGLIDAEIDALVNREISKWLKEG